MYNRRCYVNLDRFTAVGILVLLKGYGFVGNFAIYSNNVRNYKRSHIPATVSHPKALNKEVFPLQKHTLQFIAWQTYHNEWEFIVLGE